MSNSHLFMKAGFPRAPLQNGIGRWIGQLQRVTIKFCKNHASSRGMREFIEFNLVDFAKQNPGIVVYVKPRRHRTPSLTAEYLNGGRHVINCKQFTHDEIIKWMSLLRTQSGREELRLVKLWQTEHPSIQGPWTPFTNRDTNLNLAQFPNEELSKPHLTAKSATDKLVEIFQEQHKEKELRQAKGGQ